MDEYCNGKRRYKSAKVAKRVRNFREHASPALRIYECDRCFGWHLTKQKKNRRSMHDRF